ncbi:MAG TPA: glucose-6-phosphate dehydrogenase assembly protein OpcA, partial [Bryobacteraceae bacterium]|nr:glucose-6-phosphate dehydrogenase assembly protein OpcA [Bryobacteraceae bacterium]
LKDLGKLWVDLGKQEQSGVLRACAMTLIVVVEDTVETQNIGETIAALMHEHPSRAVVLRVRGGEDKDLEARVFAQCWMPFGRRQQICCENIEITASIASLADVPSVIRGLLVADLPVVLYCPSENLWKLQQFTVLLPLAQKVILDSYQMNGSLRVPQFLNKLPRALIKADLAWTRLTPWRESVSRIFDEPSRRRAVYDLREVQILYKAASEPAAAYYLAGWFMHVLGSGVKLNIAAGVGPELASIARVALVGPQLEASLELMDHATVELHVNGVREQVTLFPSCTPYDALRQELAVVGGDRVFEDVLGLTQIMRGDG